MSKRALISVTNKEGIVDFAKKLLNLGYEIVSTGNTYKILNKANINALKIDEVTNFPEILDGRVKTLNPYIHGGILFKRDKEEHINAINEHNIKSIDMVVVNLYDFEGSLKQNKNHEEMIENIDIGGPTLIRAASKNYKDVIVVVDPSDYNYIIEKLKNNSLSIEDKSNLAFKAFSMTARYDSLISNYFANILGEKYPKYLNLTFEKESELRYGENPHQRACFYKESFSQNSILDFEKLNGKELSFNNINDLYGCLDILKEFKDEDKVASVAIKHTNPCGVATGENAYEAFKKCYEADSVSIFGGIVGINSTIDEQTANILNSIFLEIVVAYDYTPKALEILKQKKNLRILKIKDLNTSNRGYDFKYLDGKLLAQDENEKLYDKFEVVTKTKPSKSEIEDMKFGMKIVKHMKSNGIAIVKDGKTMALGPGQTSRIFSLENALYNNKDKDFNGAVLASDAFFPFDDCVRLASKYGIKAIVQPGGSLKDEDSIKACDELGISMTFTGIRHFKH
ncbi:bifunctional phosphoribosylaminoimidazolecarboxamide formyltransferase/IMP cyclohydrolase [Tepidibacter formicigenes]|jgi:phosphoribosylaminoimidazolecarboxamide formyltransferase/IMP cyclohydrolase|uniref:Bifunctional purine biosynthesis protein PurH n=1 Tax=Tepidibacter formicigenes DSM 15518 TaxID=1123349 RepID=A0A1M6NDZ2_9FIRM|nr:bifunctional phosphoribosylaminoimidazolecarboxamide formyltransferase/IMP cyclohydrolase [Tepidibacter formicigenes]SHJ93910.1 phosphoribosylaminoimidazolecarboxamide formyltransferase / IMP cyclohydrolase [Tepidibacter formicigenes DSM 15518]